MNDIILRFKNAIQKDRLSHLYLLSGSSAENKLKLAKEIAYEIFKSSSNKDNLKELIDSGNYPNFVYITKEGLSIKKEQIMALQKEFSKTSLVSGKRVYVIEYAETMSVSAANSLLKFLEEPKGDETIGILLTEDLSSMLPTILSRAQIVRIVDLSKEEIVNQLRKHDIDLKNAKFLTEYTKDINKAIELIHDSNYINAIELYDEIVLKLALNKQSFLEITNKLVMHYSDDKEWLTFVLTLVSSTLLDVMHLYMNLNVYFDFMKDELLAIVNRLTIEKVQKMIEATHTLIENLRLPINVNLNLTAYAIILEEITRDGRS
ncbi:hypothetical protein [Acholeplasma hippikon]|nr:hypothetical protein [Acholeplasma hippikon]